MGLTTAVSPSASAATDEIQGGCFFDSDRQAAVTADQNVGVLGDHSVTRSDLLTPIGATVICTIYVNGVAAVQATFGDGTTAVQAGAEPISYTANDGDVVSLCTDVHYADGTVDRCTGCEACSPQFPPQWILDTLDALFTEVIDPALCPKLASVAGSYGPFTVKPDGDVYLPDPLDLGLNPIEDCPPYGS